MTYFAHGHTMHALLWRRDQRAAAERRHPASQVKFHVNYAGGVGSSLGAGYWRHVSKHNVCGPYTGPPLYRMVKACTAPDGSNWALQRVAAGAARQRLEPPRTSTESAWELHVSHWSGALPDPVVQGRLDLRPGARGGPFDHIYGTFTYQGQPVYGFGVDERPATRPTASAG